MIRILAVLLAFMAMALAGARADDPPNLDAVATIQKNGTIVVAMIDQDFPPMITTDPDGTAAGFDATIAATIADALGVKLKLIRTAKTFEEVVDQVARGDADIAVSYLTATVTRARRVVFTQPYLSQSLVLAINRVFGTKHFQACPTLDTFFDHVGEAKVGLVQNSAYQQRFKSLRPDMPYQPYSDAGGLLAAVSQGDADIAILGNIVASFYLDKNPEQNVFVSLCELATLNEDISIAVNGQVAGLVPFLDVLLDNVTITADSDGARLDINPWY